LEELLPKDNEKMPLPDLATLGAADIQPFAADQMVRCDACLRANPPTRVNCLYCGGVMPVTENSVRLQKPALRRLETWEQGFNTILLPDRERIPTVDELRDLADFLKLKLEELQRIVSNDRPLPVAHAATNDEAKLIRNRLNDLGLKAINIPDEQLFLEDRHIVRIRSATINDERIIGYQVGGVTGVVFDRNSISLLVVGRLVTKRVEVKERKSHRSEDEIVNASEFFSDEAILDIYGSPGSPSCRIESGSFDFSVLGNRKKLVASENLRTLIGVISEGSPQAEVNDSYAGVRQTLEPVWPVQQRTQAIGWHREPLGKYSTTDATESTNENQFTRYSRLLYHLKLQNSGPPNEQS